MADKQRLKILFTSEASFINSGFGNYSRELLNRLYSLDKYDLAELACYGTVNDARDQDIRWKYYANAVNQNDPRYSEYMSRTDNQFGRWRFDKVVLDFKPHVNVDIRDYWMSSYQGFSPLRPYFNWVLMPTVDSAPQQEQWIDTYINADAVFTYSDWAAGVLREQSNGKINLIDTASPGVDLNIFKPIEDKRNLRKKYGLPEDAIIIGSVMRNQKRKLIPELLHSVRKLIDRLYEERSPYADKIYLYLHTSYPDAGWDIPELLKEARMSNRTLFTYKCSKCQNPTSCTYSSPSKLCGNCFTFSNKFISVSDGVPNNVLSEIYNLFDLYVQYSICEGFGLPQIEAGACGVPVATVNYSAMEDIIEKLEAYPIAIASYFKELETKAIRVYPDNNNLIDIMYNHIHLSLKEKEYKSKRIRHLTETHYSWDQIAKKWEQFFDSEWLFTSKKSWTSKPKIIPNCDTEVDHPKSLINNIFNVCINNMNDTSFINELLLLDMCKNASYGFMQSGMSLEPFSGQDAMKSINTIINNHNHIEHIRQSNTSLNDDFIMYAKLKASL